MEKSQHGYGAAGGEDAKDETSHTGHHTSPRVVVVGTETAIFQEDSPVRERIVAYTKGFASTDIIVMCGRGFKEAHPRDSVAVYPTNSRVRFMRILDAIRIGKKLSRADVVTVQDPFETGLTGLFIARRLGAKLHVQVHTDPFAAGYATHSFVNFLRAHMARSILKKADGIRVVSGRVKAALEARIAPQCPIVVLPIFVDVEAMRNVSATPELTRRFAAFKARLLVVSRLESEKNVALAISAFAKSAPKDACLIIVGDGREQMALKRQAQNLGVMGRVFFEGKQDPAAYYALADLILVSSHYEGYGLVVVEALAAGKPVLSTDVGVAREAGAIIASSREFSQALARWFEGGPREGVLSNYPYRHFEEYVHAYCADIEAVASPKVAGS
ncbi:MAG TPA: glycosyltransferase [Candidatus Paceibacterota bacterium]